LKSTYTAIQKQSEDPVEAQNIINVGEKIKEFRSGKNMSLRSLSQRSGISANALSLIERSKTSPTVTTLTAIARAFNVRLDEFFSNDGEGRGNLVVYRGVGIQPGKPMEPLAPNLKQQNLNPLLVRLEPKEKFRKDLCFHPGDEFVYCLSGEIECEVGEEKIRLTQGDAVTYKAEMPHRLNNLASAGSQAIVIFEVGHLV
jgi:transcriptional regulator with XRE-family HTH domain